MQNNSKRGPLKRHVISRTLLLLLAIVMLAPVVITGLYSFFSPEEIREFMQKTAD